MSTLIVGDVHGKIQQYWDILQKHKGVKSIQVGDFGFKREHEWHLKNNDAEMHKINFGNHDDYSYVNHPHSLGDYSILKGEIMTIRGAYSIDKAYRKRGVDWWANEELDYVQMQSAIDTYNQHKPKIVISHDCPQEIREYMFCITEKSLTTNGLQSMFEQQQPDLWIFGHHHKSMDMVINGTRFICLSELETFNI